MSIKSKKIVLGIVFIVLGIFLASELYAGTKAADVMNLKSKVYKKHKQPVVKFTHKKHSTTYKALCGECHHDKNNKPLKLKIGDDVQKCSACHKKVGKMEKGAKKTDWHKKALHANCKYCHKKFNKKTKSKKAPTSCKQCHKK